jgi:hypothetical protein
VDHTQGVSVDGNLQQSGGDVHLTAGDCQHVQNECHDNVHGDAGDSDVISRLESCNPEAILDLTHHDKLTCAQACIQLQVASSVTCMPVDLDTNNGNCYAVHAMVTAQRLPTEFVIREVLTVMAGMGPCQGI